MTHDLHCQTRIVGGAPRDRRTGGSAFVHGEREGGPSNAIVHADPILGLRLPAKPTARGGLGTDRAVGLLRSLAGAQAPGEHLT